jgi:hypothetical protein
MPELRWERCIEHRGDEALSFMAEYFGQDGRRVALVAGGGFDPRALAVCQRLADSCKALRILLLREERSDPARELVDLAAANLDRVQALDVDLTISTVEIFGPDNAVIGGRNAVRAVANYPFDSITDVVVDLSALSVGTAYPVIRYLCEQIRSAGDTQNLHVFVTADPAIDEAIRPVAGDTVGFVHGFRGGWALDSTAAAAKLWLPQLARGRNSALQRIHDFLAPHDTCPILPFPSTRPRQGDELVQSFTAEVESSWLVDPRNFVYASDEEPLDLYRTISKIDDLRKPVFAETGGSLIILSPLGSKVLALGGLLAALERDLPVAYLEAIAYELDGRPLQASAAPNLIHLWLVGEVYTGSEQ